MRRTSSGLILALLLGAGATSACSDATDPPGEDSAAQGTTPPTPLAPLAIAEGFEMEAVATGLDFPTAIAIHRDTLWVAEAGLPPATPKIKSIIGGNVQTVLAATDLPAGTFEGPLTDVTYYAGWLYVTHRQMAESGWLVGAISRFRPADAVATMTTLISGLPAAGDHYAEEIVFDDDGRAYFSIGTATNSGIVGLDNLLVTQWLEAAPTFHDYPPVDVLLAGGGYVTTNPLTTDRADVAVTAPFSAFNSGRIRRQQRIEGVSPSRPRDGIIAGNGTVYSFDAGACGQPVDTLELEAWGLRNPYGIAFDPLKPGRLLITNNGADARMATVDGELRLVESRPLGNDYDDLFAIDTTRTDTAVPFFGWPDYAHDPQTGEPVGVVDPRIYQEYQPLEGGQTIRQPRYLLASRFRQTLRTESALAQFDVHSSANKFDASVDDTFGAKGELFVAETGAFVPVTGAENLSGYKVVRVNRTTGEVTDFVAHATQTQRDIFDPASLNKPIDVKLADGVMYIVDFGIFEPGLELNQAGTGKVWRVVPEGTVRPGETTRIDDIPVPDLVIAPRDQLIAR